MRDIGWIAFKELRVGLVLGAGHGRRLRWSGRATLGVGTDIALVVALTILAICIWSATVRRSCRWSCGGCGSTRRSSRRR